MIQGLVYHASLGFGYAVDAGVSAGSCLNVLFADGARIEMPSESLCEVPWETAEFFAREGYLRIYIKRTLDNGRGYYSGNRVGLISFDGTCFTAPVRGTKQYISSLRFRRAGVTATCSCPVEVCCKHTAAMCLKLHENLFRLLRTAKEQGLMPGDDANEPASCGPERAEELRPILSRLQSAGRNFYAVCRELTDACGSYCSVSMLSALLERGERVLSQEQQKKLVVALACGRNTAGSLAELFETDVSRELRFLKYTYLMVARGVQEREKNLRTRDGRKYCFLCCYMNHETPQALNYALYYPSAEADVASAVEEVLKEAAGSAQCVREYTAFLTDGGEWLPIKEKMLRLLPQEERLKLYRAAGSGVRLLDEDLSGIAPRELLAAFRAGRVSETGNKLLLSLIPTFPGTYAAESAELLLELARSGRMFPCRRELVRCAECLPDGKLFAQCLDRLTAGLWGDEILEDSSDEISAEVLERYFIPRASVDNDDGKARESYSLLFSDGTPGPLSAVETDRSRPAVTDSLLYEKTGRAAAKTLAALCRERFGEELRAQKTGLQACLDEIEREEKARRLQQETQLLAARLRQRRIPLAENALAETEFRFYLVEDERYPYCVDFRIGCGKKYVVKDAFSFLRMFSERETVRYGKNFELTHEIGNLKREQRDAIRLLLRAAGGFSSIGAEKRYLPLTGELFYALLDALRGQTVLWEDETYLVSLRELEPKLEIDDGLRLRPILPVGETPRFLPAGEEVLAVESVSRELCRLGGTEEEKQIFLFGVKHSGEDLTPVLDTFRDRIYAGNRRAFDVAPEAGKQLKVSALEISAYFDWTEGAITVRTELEKDGRTVLDRELAAPGDEAALEDYRAWLESFGFVGGVLREEGKLLTFFSMDLSELKKLCRVYLSDSLLNKKVTAFERQNVRVQYENHLMEAFLTHSAYSDQELRKILKAIRKKKKFILLSGDRIVDLSGQEAASFAETVKDLGLDEENLSRPRTLTLAQALRAFAHESDCTIDEYLLKMVEDIRNFKKSTYPLPELRATLRGYQADGFRWMKILTEYQAGGILADDMGLGKTLEMIALLQSDETQKPSMVVCPKSLVFNWKNEFQRFAPEADVREIYGSQAQRRELIEAIEPDRKIVYVTSYDSLRNDLEAYGVDFAFLVLDEAQYIKNVQAKKSRTVKSLAAQHRFALTGTPIENSVLDLWSIFDFLMPGYLEDLECFRSEYKRDEAFTARVAKRIAPFLLRRTKGDVLTELPEKFERVLSVDMTPQQRRLYDAYTLEARERLEENGKAFEILPYLTRLRQLCDDPGTFLENYTGGSGKLEALLTLTREYLQDGHRLLIFSQFVTGLQRLETMLRENGIETYKITGSVPAKERIRLMNDFNAGKGPDVFLISLKAGGTGLNLVGADTVIHLDPWWNVAAENQASDRAHRIGQKRSVEVIYLICEDSVEQKVIELQNIKKDVVASLISDDESSVTGITLEDISFLLRN